MSQSAVPDAFRLHLMNKRIARLKRDIAFAAELCHECGYELVRASDPKTKELNALKACIAAHPLRPDVETITALTLTRYDETLRERYGNYWCGVRNEDRVHKTSGVQREGRVRIAFRKPRSLMLWMNERGLTLSEPLPFEGPTHTQKVIGSYREASHLSYDVFYSIVGERTRVMSNGSCTMAIISVDDDGLRTFTPSTPIATTGQPTVQPRPAPSTANLVVFPIHYRLCGPENDSGPFRVQQGLTVA